MNFNLKKLINDGKRNKIENYILKYDDNYICENENVISTFIKCYILKFLILKDSTIEDEKKKNQTNNE